MSLPIHTEGEVRGLLVNPHGGLFAPDVFTKSFNASIETRVDPRETPQLLSKDLYAQLVSEALVVVEAGFPNLAQLALRGDGILLCIGEDGK